MSVSETAPTSPDLREQVANALAGSNLREVGDDGTLVRPFAAKSPMAFAYADAALSVVAPVLEGLRAEIERLTAGADDTPIPDGTMPTPGQWIASWNSLTAEQRLERAKRAMEDLEGAWNCTIRQNHKWRIEQLTAAVALLCEQRDAYEAEYIQMKHNWAAAREANTKLLSRPPASDQTPATPSKGDHHA